MNPFFDRMLRAAKLDARLYEEVENDPGLLGQAMAVVVLASLAAGIGMLPRAGTASLLLGIVSALVGWFVWAYLIYLVGTRLLPEPQTRADYRELLRTIGFASSPGVIRVLGIIPGLAGIVFFIAGIWMLSAMILAAKQALDYQSTLRAVGVCLIGWVIQFLFLALVFLIVGGPQGSVPDM